MKDKIIQILKDKSECSINLHSDFNCVDETQFESVADEVVKLFYNLHTEFNYNLYYERK